MALVVGASPVVGAGLGRFGGELSRRVDGVAIERRADQSRRRVGSVDGGRPDAGQPDARPGDAVARHLHRNRHADGGEVADTAFKLEVTAGPGPTRWRHHRLDGDLVVGEHRLERTVDEVVDRNDPLPARALGHDGSLQRDHHRGPVALRVGVADRADKRPSCAHERVGHNWRRRSDRGLMIAERCRFLEIGVTAQRTDAIRAIGIGPVVVETTDAVDVDEHRRGGETQLHHRDEALAPRKDLRLAISSGEQGYGLGECRGGFVAEAGWIHTSAPRRLPTRSLRIRHSSRHRVGIGIGTSLLVRRPRPLDRLSGDFEIVDNLRPRPDRRACAFLGCVLDDLVQPRVASTMA